MHPVLFVFDPTNRAVVCSRQQRSEGVLLLAGQLGEVPLGLLDHHAGQSHQGDQVGDGHEAVEGSGDKTVAKVRFGSEEKRLLLRYAPLEKVS